MVNNLKDPRSNEPNEMSRFTSCVADFRAQIGSERPRTDVLSNVYLALIHYDHRALGVQKHHNQAQQGSFELTL